jgi:pyruvate/2-oxoglutarate dehydrogenase complex dihydrolipoamide dehydrogenase (E3) component
VTNVRDIDNGVEIIYEADGRTHTLAAKRCSRRPAASRRPRGSASTAQFTYIFSLDDSRIVTDQLTGRGRRSTLDRKFVPYTVFMSPALSRVGLTEREAVERGLPVKVVEKAVADIAGMPRAKIVGDTRGLMKFVVDRETDRILGAALPAMRHGVPASELRDASYPHPSSTEAFNEVLAAPPVRQA